MTALGDTPCPKCSKRCHLMAGVNVIPQFKSHRFIVCWRCKLVKLIALNSQWTPLAEAKKMLEKGIGNGNV